MDFSSTKIPLVLLPGLDGTDIFFAPLLQHLPEWIDPIVVSYPQDSNNAYEELLPLVMQKIAVLDSFAVLGWSFGGPLALMVAESHPGKVSSVILCGTFVSSPRRWLVPVKFLLSPPVVASIRAIRRLRLLIPGYASPALRKAKAETWRAVKARALASRAKAALMIDARNLLQKCRAGLMYMASTRDEVISRKHLHEIRTLVPHIQLAEIEGPHLALFTNPAQSADCIVNFIRQQVHT